MAAGRVTIAHDGNDYIIYVDEHESGSATSFGARTLEQGYQNALEWLGFGVFFQ